MSHFHLPQQLAGREAKVIFWFFYGGEETRRLLVKAGQYPDAVTIHRRS